MPLLHIKLPQAHIGNPTRHVIILSRRNSPGEKPRRVPTGAPARSGDPGEALGEVDRPGNGGPESPSPGFVNVFFVESTIYTKALEVIGIFTASPFPLKEEQWVFPPTLSLVVVVMGLFGVLVFFRDGL